MQVWLLTLLIGLLLTVLLGAVYTGMVHLSGQRRRVRDKLARLKGGIDQPSRKPGPGSIRLRPAENGLRAALSGFIPQSKEVEKRIARAGLSLSIDQYAQACALCFGASLAGLSMAGVGTISSAFLSITLGLGLPHFWLMRRAHKRTAAFVRQFPEALELMVRGLRSGLPVADGIAGVAQEMADPIGAEFRRMSDTTAMGKTLDEALWASAERIDVPDFKFFVIALSIQRETGGNLAETLANLATVLRQRQGMTLKVRAMSSEAKASAWIIGALPFVMYALLLFINPDYASILYTDARALMIALGMMLWMGIGVFIMSRMVNFKH